MGNFFKNLFSWFANFGKDQLLVKFEMFLQQVFTAEKIQVMAALQNIAQVAVAKAAVQFTNPTEKNSAAVAEVLEYAKQQGITVASSLVKTIVELAYQDFQNTTGNQGVVTTGTPVTATTTVTPAPAV